MKEIEYIVAAMLFLYLLAKIADTCTDRILKSLTQISNKLDRIDKRVADEEELVFMPDHPLFVEKE